MHYVMSDIHGQYVLYKKMLNRIRFSDEDHLYIIGDAIDRGPDSIPLLLDIMSRENVTFLIGNHEHMMFRSIALRNGEDLYTWMYNRGENTLSQYEELDKGLQKHLLRWLYNCPLIIPCVSVGDRQYYLAHACHSLYPEKEVLLYKDAGFQNIEQVVWSREYMNISRPRQGYIYNRLYAEYPNTTLIIGHTPVQKCSYGAFTKKGFGRISHACSGHLINVDCGCALGKTLGCLRLEDGKEFYCDLDNDGIGGAY